MKENMKSKLQKKGGFTLIELLIVVAIIAILIAISIPLVGGALEKAKNATDAANVRAAIAEASIKYLTDDGAAVSGKYDAKTGSIVKVDDSVDAYGKAHTGVVWIEVDTEGNVTWLWSADATTKPTDTYNEGMPLEP